MGRNGTKDKCGARRKDGTTCRLPAGWGTDHVGVGQCKKHLGNTRAHRVAGARELVARRMLSGLDNPSGAVEPTLVLLEEVRRSQSIVSWFDHLLRENEIGSDDLFMLTEQGFKPRAFMEVYERERSHLAKVASLTIGAGVAERLVRVEEEKGRQLALAIQGILKDLELSPAQKQKVPTIVRKHLQAIPTTATEVTSG